MVALDSKIIVAHRSQSAQEADPFHYYHILQYQECCERLGALPLKAMESSMKALPFTPSNENSRFGYFRGNVGFPSRPAPRSSRGASGMDPYHLRV